MKVTLYAIAKNEEKNVEKFINNSKKFFDTVVVDTGSTDNTIQLLTEAGIRVYSHPQSREEFDFSVARNKALSYVETDWAFSLDFNEDVDELFIEGLSPIESEFTAFKHLRFDKVGDKEPTQSEEVHLRFHRKDNYAWQNAVHEIPAFIPTESHPNEMVVDITTRITKEINKTVDKELFYLDICEREFKKNNTNWYYNWFIFNHYFSVRDFNSSLELGKNFLDNTKAYFNSFRIPVFIKTSISLLNLGDVKSAANYAFHAVSEAMNMGGTQLSQAFSHLNEIGKIIRNPNITIFATGFNENTLSLPERTEAIDSLFLSNLDDIPSCWKGHRGFAEWLVNQVKPNTIVDLGVDWGFSTFCFGMPRIGHVYGVDSFEGDQYTGGNHGNYEYVISKQEKLFMRDNVTFIKGYFDDVAKSWDKKIDILHIDGSHSYEDIKNDYNTWSKFLSEDGIVLLHDTYIEELNGNIYGVKRFFEEIDLPKVTFTHSFGLGVISKNKEIIEKIKETFNLDGN